MVRPSLVLVVAAAACSSPDAGQPDAAGAPAPLSQRINTFDLAAGQELTNQCVSWTLDNDTPLFINEVNLSTGTGFHHSNWFWVPETSYAGPDGAWRCSDRNYDEALAAAMGGVLFAQTTQAVDETQAFPPGVAIAIPPHAKIVAGVHLLNTSDEALVTPLDLTLTPIAPADVVTRLAALSLTYEALEIPPGRTASFTVDCPLAARFEEVIGGPLDLKVYYALPHYHDLGRKIDIVAGGGPAGDTTVFSTMSAIGEPAGKALTPAFDLTGFQSLRFSCEFTSDRTNTVRWGVGDQEMCVMLAFIDGQFNWGGGVLQRSPVGTPVDDNGVLRYSRPCELYALPAHQY
ncbi:MAG: hypothetical protein IPL61_02225 [Myxococcales bacterium]|nr:hypothetical protein [Myxococcales bacterium]